MVSPWSTRHQTGDTDSFQLVIPLIVERDSQGTFVPCEARIVWYLAGRTSSQQLRDTTQPCGQGVKIGRKGPKALHRPLIAIRGHRHPMGVGPHVNPSGMEIELLE